MINCAVANGLLGNLNEEYWLMFMAANHSLPKLVPKNAWLNDIVNLYAPGEAKTGVCLKLMTELAQPGNLDWALSQSKHIIMKNSL